MARLPRTIGPFRALGVAASLAAIALLPLLSAGGCGHSVEPRGGYGTPIAIPAPDSLRIALDPGGNVVLTWQVSDETRRLVDGWRIERHFTLDDPVALETLALVRDTVYFDQTIQDDQWADYRVSAVTAAGVVSAPAITLPIRCDRLAPVPPRNVVVSPLSGALEVAFVPSRSLDVAWYEIRVDLADQSGPAVFGLVDHGPGIVDHLTPGVEYGVTVTAIDSVGRQSVPSGYPVLGIPNP